MSFAPKQELLEGSEVKACNQGILNSNDCRRGSTVSKGVDLNTNFRQFSTAKEMYTELLDLTKPGGDYTVRNFVGVIRDMSLPSSTVITDLFPPESLTFYTAKNLGESVSKEDVLKYQTDNRGGDQGDYSSGMPHKIRNVIDCLKSFPYSKRAVLPIPFSDSTSKSVNYEDQGQTKCVRELYFYIEDNKLKCTGILRMQNAVIFPKNIHFISALMNKVASEVGYEVGEYTHFITSLCRDRNALHY